jgi:hypothetical protein
VCFFGGVVLVLIWLPDIELLLPLMDEPELMLPLLPDMELLELPAGVLCAKAGAATKAAAKMAATAALEIVFMVCFLFGLTPTGHPVVRFGQALLCNTVRNMVQPAARIAPPLGA